MVSLGRFGSLRLGIYYRSIPASGCRRASHSVKTLKRPMKKLLILFALAGFFGTCLQAQQQVQLKVGDVDVGKMEYDAQKTPSFQAGDVKGKNIPNPRDWLELEVEFRVKGDPKTVVKELLFR